jgi:RimJ/RimL family protein N-acetyltransferase
VTSASVYGNPRSGGGPSAAAPAGSPSRPPELIDAGPVVLCRNTVDDAGLVADAIRESLDHLRPWMPWATEENATVEHQATRLAGVAAAWEAGTEFVYVARFEGDPSLVGMIGMHRRIGPGGIEIGYWAHARHAGRGYMGAAARAVTNAAAALPDITRVEIHTDEANVRSAAIPRRLGFRLERVDRVTPDAPACTGRMQIWVKP